MARLFILFLIALLPLRGWTVERMAVDMGSASLAQSSVAVGIAMLDDCALHMQMAQKASGQAVSDLSQGVVHKGCQSCQLCMALAAPDAPVALAPAANPQALPPTRSSRFVSADRARDAKPPIS